MNIFDRCLLTCAILWFIHAKVIDFIGSLLYGNWYGRKMQWYCKWWGWILPHN